jgi:hypothetical protein
VEKIISTDRIRNEEVLQAVKEERNVLHAIRRMEVKWICHILHRNCLLEHVIEGKIEVMVRRGRRRKQLLGDLKEKRGCRKLKEEVVDRTVWRNCF